MHKNILLQEYLSHSNVYSTFGIPRQMHRLPAVTGLTAILVCLPLPEDNRVMFDSGEEKVPYFRDVPAYSSSLDSSDA